MALLSLRNIQRKQWYAIQDIIRCLYLYTVKDRIRKYFVLILTGILNKIFALLTFVVIIQAVIALVMPEKLVALFHRLGLSQVTEIISEHLDYVAYGSILSLQIATVILFLIHHYFLNDLSKVTLSESHLERGLWDLKDDIFMIEHLNLAASALLRFLIASGYLLVLICMMAFFSFALVLVLLPSIIILVFLQLMAVSTEIDQKGLLNEKKSQWLKAYRRAIDNSTEEKIIIYKRERKKYLYAKGQVESKKFLNSVWLTTLGSAFLLVIVYTITKVPDMDITFLISYLIFFVFAARGMVSSLREITTNFNLILNLRKYRVNIINLLKHSEKLKVSRE